MSQQFDGRQGMTIELPQNTVAFWFLVSQSAGQQHLMILDPQGNQVVNTCVLSRNLSNRSVGSFPVTTGGAYTVLFPTDPKVIYETATLSNGRLTISESYMFAGEDWIDNDYNDAFAILTWFGATG